MPHVKFAIIPIILLVMQIVNAQDYNWQQVNPWRLHDVFAPVEQNNEVFHLTQSGKLIHVLDADYNIDTLIHNFFLDINSFGVLNQDSIYLSAVLTNGNQGVFLYHTDDQDWEFLFDIEGDINLDVLGDKVVALETKLFGFGDNKLSLLKGDELIELLEFSEENPELYTGAGIMVLYKDRNVYFSNDYGESWIDKEYENKIQGVTHYEEGVIAINDQSEYVKLIETNSFEKVDSIEVSFEFLPLFLPKHVFSFQRVNELLFASYSGNEVVSNDYGETWSQASREIRLYERGNSNYIVVKGSMFLRNIYGIEKYDLQLNEFNSINNNYLTILYNLNKINDSLIYLENHNYRTGTIELYKTNNFGSSFMSNIEVLTENYSVSSSNLNMYSEFEGFLINRNDSTIYKTTDSGYTWDASFKQDFNVNSRYFFFNKNDMFCFDGNSLHYSANSGMDWSAIELELTNYELHDFEILEDSFGDFWVTHSNLSKDSIHLYKYEDLLLSLIHAEEKLSSSSIFIDSGLLYFSSGSKSFIINIQTNDVTQFLTKFSRYRLLQKSGESLIVERNDSIYFYPSEAIDHAQGELQMMYGKPLMISSDFVQINSKGEILISTFNGNMIKYGPPIDKSIYTGIEDEIVNYEKDIFIYPNPFEGHIIVDHKEALQHTLYDMNGNQVLTSDKNIFSTLHVPSGMYILVSTQNGKLIGTRKMVKVD